jgi:hypothetical protein
MKMLQRMALWCSLVLSGYFAQAQNQLGELIGGSVADANYMASGYISPLLKAFGNGLNQGWYNTAKAHKPLGVDLTISVSPVYIPNSDLLYEIDNTKLQNVKLEQTHDGRPVTATGKGMVPTVFGPDQGPRYRYYFNNLPTPQTFTGSEGLALKDKYGLQAIPIPIANLGIGLPFNTDLKVRFIPTINLGDMGKLNMFGVGVMHDVKQWIPGIKQLPFDLSAFVGYTKLKLSTTLDNQRPDQKGEFEVNATTIQGLISKKISVLTLYGGLGYNISKGSVNLRGNYDLNGDGTYTDKDPLSIAAKSSGMRATAGLRLKLAVLTLHGDYTLQKYKTLTVGIGIAIR